MELIIKVKDGNKTKEVSRIDYCKEVPAKCDTPSRVHLLTLYMTNNSCKSCI